MQVLPSHLDFCKDHRQISRIVSFVWAGLPAAEKQLFFQLSEEELRIHQRNFPSFSLAPSKSSKSKALKDIDIPTKEKEIRLNPEELQCKQIAELVLRGLQGDELSARVEEVVAGYIARKHAQQSPKVKSGSTSKARNAALRIKGQTRTVVSRVAAPRFPRPKEQRKTSKQTQPKLRSSTSISKGGKASLVSNLPPSPRPPRRRCVPLSFTQYLSDEEEEYEPLETQRVEFARGTTPPLSIFAEDVTFPPLSDSDDSSASFTSRSFESVLSEEGAMSVPPESSIGDPTISWTEEEHWDHSFDEEEDRFESMEIVDSAPFAEFGVHLRPVGYVNLYEQLEREFFAERARTPFDPDNTFSSSSFGLHWETPWFDPFQADDEILDSEESIEPITVSLSDLSPRRRR
ncbi:hypothetical protein FRC17_006282 [Serendipita sp. 399]|nr:hypothetical protein FRC17_006282 [Serendipita sp. 399]